MTPRIKVQAIEGVGPVFAKALAAAGVKTVDDLSEKAASPKGRDDLAARTGIGAGVLLKWANHADLMRIQGIGPQFAELLEASGVDTVKELAQRNAANLSARMSEVNREKRLAGSSSGVSQVAKWIESAKRLKPAIGY